MASIRVESHRRLMDAFKEAVAAGLAGAGYEAALLMKRHVPKSSERLHDSITYAVKSPTFFKYVKENRNKAGNPNKGLVGMKAESGDAINGVGSLYKLKVGTKVPYAIYVDKGTGRHKTSQRADEFVQNMFDWGTRKGFSETEIYAIIQSIRKEGTSAHPFMAPVEAYLRKKAVLVINKTVRRALGRLPKMSYHISNGKIRKYKR